MTEDVQYVISEALKQINGQNWLGDHDLAWAWTVLNYKQ